MGLTYRWLYRDDLNQLEPTLRAQGWISLNEERSAAIAAFDGDRLVGFLVVQEVPHVEPLFVDLQYRGSGVAEELGERMAEKLREHVCRGVMIIANNPASAKLAEKFGMEKITSPVYSKIDLGEGI
jgi:hypothetical protein